MLWNRNNLPENANTLSPTWSDEQFNVFLHNANKALNNGCTEKEAEAMGLSVLENKDLTPEEAETTKDPSGGGGIVDPKKDVSEEKQNAKQYPKRYYARHMFPGMCGYLDETVQVGADCMKKMSHTFTGKPLFVGHKTGTTPEDIESADGYVVKSFYNEKDGWLWAEFMAVTDAAHDAVAKGWAVSNAYLPTKSGEAGTVHNVNFDREILDGEFTHLALVPDPRYEEATILTPEQFAEYQNEKDIELKEIKNSKTKTAKKEKTMLKKLWKKTPVEGSEEILNAMVDLENGTSVSVSDMAKFIEKTNAEDKTKDKEEKVNMDMKVPVGDSEMSLKELVAAYTEKKNADEEDKKDKEKENTDEEDKKDKEKENESEEDKKAKTKKEEEKANALAEEKDNADKLKELENAKASNVVPTSVETSATKVQRGKDLYGSPKTEKGN